jgi:hypothetical protein
MPLLPFEQLDCGGGVDWSFVPVQNPVLGQHSGLLQLENRQGLGQSLLDVYCMNSFATDFVSSSSSRSNSDIDRHFHHFGCFPSLKALMTQFFRVLDRVLSSNALSTNSFIPANFLMPKRAQ